MQDQNGDGAGKRGAGKRQGRGIALHGVCGWRVMLRQFQGQSVVIFETGDARRATPQLAGGGSGSRAYFENMIAERHIGENPGEEFLLGGAPPEGRGAEPILKDVQFISPCGESRKDGDALKRALQRSQAQGNRYGRARVWSVEAVWGGRGTSDLGDCANWRRASGG